MTTGFADVFSLDPNDGHEIWHSTVSAPVRGAPLVFDDRVFSISIDNKLHAMAAVDGSDLWIFTGLRRSRAMSAATARRARRTFVVAPFTSGELVCLRAENGRTVWNESLVGPRRELRAFGNLADIRGRPVIDRDLVDRHGLGRHGRAPSTCAPASASGSASIGGNQTPWVAGEFVFVVTGSADVAALEPRRPAR